MAGSQNTYTIDQLEKALREHNCRKTEVTSSTACYWRASNSEMICVPHADMRDGTYSSILYLDIVDSVKVIKLANNLLHH